MERLVGSLFSVLAAGRVDREATVLAFWWEPCFSTPVGLQTTVQCL